MAILAISTSTQRGSVAVLEDDRVLGETIYEDTAGHAERLFRAIDRALATAGVEKTSLRAIAADVGPGSFTGVRIAVASAKGIALTLGLPLIGVGSLDAMAAAAFGEGLAKPGDHVLAGLDAKKSEIFFATFDDRGRATIAPRHASFDGFAEASDGVAVVVGEIAANIATLASSLRRHPSTDLPDAAWIGRLAAAELARGGDFDPALVEPRYVRAPDAKPMAP